MSKLLTKERLDAIRARDAARSPGKWYPGDLVVHTDNVRIAEINTSPRWPPKDPKADAQFIAGCSEDIPDLLADNDALRGAIRDAHVSLYDSNPTAPAAALIRLGGLIGLHLRSKP